MANGNTSKRTFLSLDSQEQLATLYDMWQAVSNSQAGDQKEHIEFRGDIIYIKGELMGIGRRSKDKTLTTSEKIDAALGKRFDVWAWFRDKVLDKVVTAIIFGVLYFVFGGKMP